MDKGIKIFENPEFGKIRVVANEEGEPLFCVSDIARVLALRPSKVVQRLDEDVLYKYPLSTSGGTQTVNFTNEDGLYDAVLDSRKPEAKLFRKWITSEVLPSIRKTGGYLLAKDDDDPESIMARAVIIAQATINRQKERIDQQQRKIEQQEIKIIEDKPKVLFYDSVTSSKTVCLVKELATILNQNGCKNIGQNRLFTWLREHGCLGTRGDYYNMPTQKAMDLDLFKVTKGTRVDPRDGSVITTRTTKVTTKGLAYFIDKFLNKG